MDEHSLSILEFATVLETLCSYCVSEHGIALLRSQQILNDRAQIDPFHERVGYLKMLLESDEPFPDLSFPEVRSRVVYCTKPGTSLEASDIANIGVYIRSARLLRSYIARELSDSIPNTLKPDSGRIPDLDPLARGITRDFEADGRIKDSVPALRSIRKRMRDGQTALQALTARYLQGTTDIWQTDVPTIKDGRTVLPLKANHRGRVPGVVRDVSPSGATIFIEPYDVVERNNELSMLEHEYLMEVAKLLREHTDRIREHADELLITVDTVSYLDTILARARYSVYHNCRRAGFAEQGFELRAARHPLLGRNAVPVDVVVEPGSRILIVTGPNAGGKTVTLKTVGLLSLMNQFGMHVPTDEGSRLSLFDEVFADIGDDQSIQASLSTFSGHMMNISRYAAAGGDRSLVLLDELGSGTDPEEGSAMAMAILDHFRAAGSTVIATTHHTVLKNYGYTTEGVMNASMEFDSDTHRPTYRVILGVPGESHALEIAADSGVPDTIVQAARDYLEEQSTDVATIIKQITQKQHELRQKEQAYERRRSNLTEKVRETDLHALRLKQHELQLRTQGYQALTKQMNEYRQRLENLVRELRESGVNTDKTREVKDYISDLEETVREEREQIEQAKEETLPARDLAPGMDVVVGRSRQQGTIVRRARKGYWVVATDKMKVTLAEEEIYPGTGKPENAPRVSVSHVEDAGAPEFQLDVRGFRLDEAVEAVDRQIDRALLAGLYEFEVIHGHGEGVLKAGIREQLKRHGSVKSFEFGDPESGGFGKTVVTLQT